MNPLQNIPAKLRAVLYIAYGVVAIGYLVLSAYYDKDPEWVNGVGRVVGALAVPFAGVAASNVTQTNTAQVVAPANVAVVDKEGPTP